MLKHCVETYPPAASPSCVDQVLWILQRLKSSSSCSRKKKPTTTTTMKKTHATTVLIINHTTFHYSKWSKQKTFEQYREKFSFVVIKVVKLILSLNRFLKPCRYISPCTIFQYTALVWRCSVKRGFTLRCSIFQYLLSHPLPKFWCVNCSLRHLTLL